MAFEVFQRPKIEPPHYGRTADCGTASGYVGHIAAGEEPDADCRAAWTGWHVDRYATDPVFRGKKLRLNATRAQALAVLADLHAEEFHRCWHEQAPGGHRRDRAHEELRRRHQAEFDAVLADLRANTPIPSRP